MGLLKNKTKSAHDTDPQRLLFAADHMRGSTAHIVKQKSNTTRSDIPFFKVMGFKALLSAGLTSVFISQMALAQTTSPEASQPMPEGAETVLATNPVVLPAPPPKAEAKALQTSPLKKTAKPESPNEKPEVKENPATQSDKVKAAALKWQEKVTPVMLGHAGRLVLTYGQSTPVLVCAPLKVCTLELEEGEVVVDAPAIGDAVRWFVEMRHRDTPVPQTYFTFKVSEDADELTNFTVITDRRVYVINLVKDNSVYTPLLSFDYPDTRAKEMSKKIAELNAAQRAKKATQVAAYRKKINRTGVKTSKGYVAADKLDFGFRQSGNARFKPTQIYTDGRKTYIILPKSYNGTLPVLLAGRGETNKALNYRVKDGNRYIVDRVLTSAVLQDGNRRIKIRRVP